jgi:hypothetical protein
MFKIGDKVFHRSRRQVGTVTSLNTGDFTSCIVNFKESKNNSDWGEYEVTKYFLVLVPKCEKCPAFKNICEANIDESCLIFHENLSQLLKEKS